ncbi:MAG: DUF4192 family protein [Rhodoglobus sp.]|nr:DUF4192 family protein [Rhodoglobus sp.]
MTEIIKANSEAELLALIPQVAGYTASNSIICVGFGGKRTIGAFRVDVPKRQREADYRAISTYIVGGLNRLPGADGVAIALYTEQTFEGEGGIPFRVFERHLTDRLHREGFAIKDAFCVAQDGWASYFDRDYPRAGRPLSEIASPIALPDIGRWAGLADVEPAEQHEFLDELIGVERDDWSSELSHLIDASPIDLVEAIVAWDGPLPLPLGATLIQLIQSPARRDVVSLQVGFGEFVAESVEATNLMLSELQAQQRGSMDDVVRREVKEGRLTLDDEFTGLLMGKGRLRPDAVRVERMIEHLRRLIALAPLSYRPNPLCVLAYLLWSRGLASAAASHIEAALNIDAHHGMSQLMATMLNHSMVPEWAYPQ